MKWELNNIRYKRGDLIKDEPRWSFGTVSC